MGFNNSAKWLIVATWIFMYDGARMTEANRRHAPGQVLATGMIAALIGSIIGAQAQDKRSLPGDIKPAIGPSSTFAEWSGRSGSSNHPLMTAEAIRAAAANFNKCLEDQRPEAQLRGVSRALFDASTAKLTPDLQIMDLL